MAQLILSEVGQQVGARIVPEALAQLGQALGQAAGSALGRVIDQRLTGARGAGGPRLAEIQVQGSSEGSSLPIVYGRARIAGQLIWAAPFRERAARGGKGALAGGSRGVNYTVSFAIGLCEGKIARIARIWANGRPLDLSGITWRLHAGDEDQAADPLIEAALGAGTPAYRGVAYVVFEEFPLDDFGATLPQLSFEIVRASLEEEAPILERLTRGVCLIPGAGEFVYADRPVRRQLDPGIEAVENEHAEAGRANLLVSLDQLQADLPNCRSVLLVIGWFGSDLRCGACTFRPKVEPGARDTTPLTWWVDGQARADAQIVSLFADGPAYGGTPSDETVLQAIAELKRRGFKVGLYPFVFMDIAPGNGLPDPYGGAEQAAYPWRGRITLSIAPGRAGSPASSASADAQIQACFRGEWGLRRFVLHYARLAVQAGGVDTFILASELRGLTQARGANGAYPAVVELRALAADCRALLGAGTRMTYAADWSEYFGHQPADGSGDVRFSLDPLWADANIDMIGVDWYPPLSDWRDGSGHLDQARFQDAHDSAYLQAGIEGGENYDWFYASSSARAAQTRSPIMDGAYSEPWVYRPKDLRSWWSNRHYDRVGGVRAAQPSAWVPQSKPIWLVELGCPAIDKGANAPNLFFDPKSTESALPFASSGEPDDVIQRRALEAYLAYWHEDSGNNPISSLYHGPMLAPEGTHIWAWDARPFPTFPVRSDIWADASAWRAGHWLNGRAGASDLARVITEICARAGMRDVDVSQLRGVVSGYVVDGPASAREALAPLLDVHGVELSERGGLLQFRHDAAAPIAFDPTALIDAPSIERADNAAPLAEVKVAFLDAAQDYRIGMVSALSGQADGIEVRQIQLPLAINPEQARRLAETSLAKALEGHTSVRLRLAPNQMGPEPGDRLILDQDAYVIERAEDGGERVLMARRSSPAAAFAPRAVLAPAPAPVSIIPAPYAFLLDLPPLPGEEQEQRPRAGAFAAPWGGLLEIQAGADAQAARPRGEITRPARIGRLLWDLYPGPVGRVDAGNVVEVVFYGEALSSVSMAALLDGANRLALCQPDGKMEILQVRDVVLAGQGRWRLSGFLRGQLDTADGMGDPAPAGSDLIVLDERLVPIDMSPEEVGADLQWQFRWRDPAGAARPALLRQSLHNLWARPFAPAHLRLALAANLDVEISWIRQSRIGGDSWATAEIALGEELESYEIEVLFGGVVRRRFSCDQTNARYLRADQLADGLSGEIAVRVAQVSRQSGAGARAESKIRI